jgi:hypothetical protein
MFPPDAPFLLADDKHRSRQRLSAQAPGTVQVLKRTNNIPENAYGNYHYYPEAHSVEVLDYIEGRACRLISSHFIKEKSVSVYVFHCFGLSRDGCGGGR